MKFTDYILCPNVWFSSSDRLDCLAHRVARDLITRAVSRDQEGTENLLKLTRRYE